MYHVKNINVRMMYYYYLINFLLIAIISFFLITCFYRNNVCVCACMHVRMYACMYVCSFGGLMACYAAGTRPLQFARAFCTSPSVWWNAGDLAGIVKDSYAASGNKPQAVTISVGTQEGV